MGPELKKLLTTFLGIVLTISILWIGTAFITACDSEPEVPWEQLDDDRDGYRNGEDLWPFNPDLH